MDITQIGKITADVLVKALGRDSAMQALGAAMGFVIQFSGTETTTLRPIVERVAPTPSLTEAPGEGPVLARKGYRCFCSGCKADIYELNADIYGKGMGVNAFIKSFVPIGNVPALTRDMLQVLKDNVGNTYIDCPVCKGTKTLMIVGQAVREGKEMLSAPPVSSVDNGGINVL